MPSFAGNQGTFRGYASACMNTWQHSAGLAKRTRRGKSWTSGALPMRFKSLLMKFVQAARIYAFCIETSAKK